MARRRFDLGERRRRLVRRHLLTASCRVTDLHEVARALVAIHSTDPVSVFLQAYARLREPTVAAIEASLYEERSVVRMLGMRRTLFVVPVEIAPVVHAAATRAIAARERRRLVDFLVAAGIGEDPEAWLAAVENETIDALRARGDAATSEMYTDVPRLARRLTLAAGKRYEATVTVGTRVMPLLAAQGHAVRGTPRGSWLSSQYRWHAIEAWLPDGFDGWSTERAQAELVRLWLWAFGPGTASDIRWWTGWTTAEVRRALAGVGATSVDIEGGGEAFVLADDLDAEAPVEPSVALLPALDATVMGWTDRDWFLGPHRPALFDTNGNAGPTVWSHGRIVGGWAQRRDGELAIRLLDDPGAEARRAIESEADRLRDWLGTVRFTPRFRTPLERELAG